MVTPDDNVAVRLLFMLGLAFWLHPRGYSFDTGEFLTSFVYLPHAISKSDSVGDAFASYFTYQLIT